MDPLTAILNIGSSIIDKIWPDKDKADQVKLEMFKAQQAGQLQEIANQFSITMEQVKVNAEEAKHNSIFVSGWRPFVGWICGFALGYNYILFPFIAWAAKWADSGAPTMPALDSGELMTLLFGMLGLGAMRSFDKKTGCK